MYRCNLLDHIPTVLSYAEPDIIRASLEIIPFDALMMQHSMQSLEILYPHFSIKTWEKFLSAFFSIEDDSVTWRVLNALFVNMSVPHDLILEIKELLVEKRGESKLFLLALFAPNVLPDNFADSWKAACQTLFVSGLVCMQEYLPKIKEQMERLTHSCSAIGKA